MVKIYKLNASPPARAAMMAAAINGVDAELIDVNLLTGENRSAENVKKNPLHTVPFMEDGDLILHDSHAIVMYITEKYGKDDSIYPKDISKRAKVNQILFFDTAILFPRLRSITAAALFEGIRKPTEKQFNDIKEAYGFMEEFLTRNKYLAGDTLTIADISAIASMTSLNSLLPLDKSKYPKTASWMNNMQKLPVVQKCNSPGQDQFHKLVTEKIDL